MRRTREKYALRKGEAALEESWHRSAAPVTTFARRKLEKNPARINSENPCRRRSSKVYTSQSVHER